MWDAFKSFLTGWDTCRISAGEIKNGLNQCGRAFLFLLRARARVSGLSKLFITIAAMRGGCSMHLTVASLVRGVFLYYFLSLHQCLWLPIAFCNHRTSSGRNFRKKFRPAQVGPALKMILMLRFECKGLSETKSLFIILLVTQSLPQNVP